MNVGSSRKEAAKSTNNERPPNRDVLNRRVGVCACATSIPLLAVPLGSVNQVSYTSKTLGQLYRARERDWDGCVDKVDGTSGRCLCPRFNNRCSCRCVCRCSSICERVPRSRRRRYAQGLNSTRYLGKRGRRERTRRVPELTIRAVGDTPTSCGLLLLIGCLPTAGCRKAQQHWQLLQRGFSNSSVFWPLSYFPGSHRDFSPESRVDGGDLRQRLKVEKQPARNQRPLLPACLDYVPLLGWLCHVAAAAES